MTAQWSVAEFLVRTQDGQPVGVECAHCGTNVKFAMPEHSSDPADVTVRYPDHPCGERPEEVEEKPGFATDAPATDAVVDVEPVEVLTRKPTKVDANTKE